MAGKDEIFGKLFKKTGSNRSVVTLDGGASLELPGARTYVVDATDSTKRFKFDASAGTAATDYTITLPGRSFAMGGGIGSRTTPLSATGGLTLTVAQSGATVLFDAVGATAVALPAIAAADVGVWYKFVWTVTATGNHTITAQAADLLSGVALMGVSGAADVDTYFPDVTDDLIQTANGSTTGGLAGSVALYEAVSATRWNVFTIQRCTGTQATPFS